MKPLSMTDIKNIYEYEKVRKDFRTAVIAHKKPRRVHVGDIVTFVFEDRQTLIFQIQEMVRAERLVEDEKVQEEIDVYNQLLPGDNELSATMFVEMTNDAELRTMMPLLPQIEHSVVLDLGDGVEVPAIAEGDRSRDDRTSSVHYLKFPMTPQAWERLTSAPEVVLRLNHRNYVRSTVLSDETRKSLAADRNA